jgi:hypothetical protein
MGKFKEIAIDEQQLREDIKAKIKNQIKAEEISISEEVMEIFIESFTTGVFSENARLYWFNKFKQDVEAAKEQD